MSKRIESIIFRVAGVTNYKKAVKQACNDIAEDNGIPEYTKYYGNLTTKEIREELEEYGGQIYKYQDLSATEVELVPEPENKYDSNALKVLLYDNFVGYVPGKIAKTIRHYFNDDKYSFVSVAEIKGGPYKEWDDYEEKVITNNDLDVGFEIYLTILDSTQNDEKTEVTTSEIIDIIATDKNVKVEDVTAILPASTTSSESQHSKNTEANLTDNTEQETLASISKTLPEPVITKQKLKGVSIFLGILGGLFLLTALEFLLDGDFGEAIIGGGIAYLLLRPIIKHFSK